MSRKAEEAYPTSAFDYELPRNRIAQYPAEQRDESRLMVLDRANDAIEHRRFRDVLELLIAGDVLVLNETRVFPARLMGSREHGGEAEVLLLRPIAEAPSHPVPRVWEALVRPGAKLKPGKRIYISDDCSIEVLNSTPDGGRVVRFITQLPVEEVLHKYGRMPLPPYLQRHAESSDSERYQTVYAREEGSVAAPTAGLHFTNQLLQEIEHKGVRIVRIVLHVGVGTFRPVEVDDPAQHVMHEEFYTVSDEAAATINAARKAGGKLWAVGTTVARTLESVADDDGTVHAGAGATALFVRPPYRFKSIDRLITNFHLPKSTLLMLVAAFAGYDLIMRAYQEAIDQEYRFYSYGDAMVII